MIGSKIGAKISAKEEILARIRAALPVAADGAASYAAIPRSYARRGGLDRESCLHLLKDRLLDYDAEILEVESEAGIAGALQSALEHAGERRLLVAEAFPKTWLPQGAEIVVDTHLPIAEMDGITTVATTCEAAIASTGTILLVHEGAQGRRAVTLLPDHHLCVVRRDQVVELVPEAIETIAASSRLAITTISGPSATSDIEMTRIRGVHGPRRLTVILYGAVS
jgi:L-lactate dehydrogenase complex protein LldG